MKILFGSYLDGSEWTFEKASLGEIACGPLGLLKLLETHLGFSAPAVSSAERINEYRKKIEALNSDWCRASFEKAPWQTASYLLSLRDTLIEAGWNGESGNTSERFDFFERIERLDAPLAPGFGDRLRRLIPEIGRERFEDWEITSSENPETFPELIRQTFSALEQAGARCCFADGSGEKSSGAESRIRVVGDSENALVAQLCRYLKSGDNESVALICEGDSSALDLALQRNGFGAIGARTASRRVADQVLPAFIKLLWKPFDSYALCEFLMLPPAPLPDVLRNDLLWAIGNEAGKGDKWDAVWKSTENANSEWRAFFEDKAFSEEKEISRSELSELCDFFIKACRSYASGNTSVGEAIDSVIVQTKTLKKIIQEQASISRELLMQILSSVVGQGSRDTQAVAGVNRFSVFAHPGALTKDFDTVVWWNFSGATDARLTYWTDKELKQVPGANPLIGRKRELAAWQNAEAHAAKNLILFSPKSISGSPAFDHPFLHSLANVKTLLAESLVDENGLWRLADRCCSLNSFCPPAETLVGMHEVPVPIAPDKTKPLSFSQIDSFIKCPFKWFLEKKLYLKKNPILRIPAGGRMIGTLAHKIIEILFKEQAEWKPEPAVARAGVLFDEWLPKMAPEFLKADAMLRRTRVKEAFLASVRKLVEELRVHRLTVVKTEREVFGKFGGYDFKGFVDMTLRDADGGDFVIDLKWSSGERFEKHLNGGKALQLASYASMLRPEDFKVRCAYFSFPDRMFIENEEQNSRWRQIWEQAERDMQERLEQLSAGKFLLPEPPDPKDEDTPCKFCDFSEFCRRGKEKCQ